MTTNVVVLVPGYTASELFDQSGKQVWPLDGASFDAALLENPNLKVGQVVQTKSNGDPLYSQIANWFEESGYNIINYQAVGDQNKFGGFEAGNSFIEFPYDWRRTNINTDGDNSMVVPGSADRFQAALADIHSYYVQEDPDYQLYFFAHSMGGLVIRNLIDTTSSDDNSFPWFSHLNWVCTLATPHLGSPTAFAALTDTFTWGELDGVSVGPETFKSLIGMKNLSGGFQLTPYFQTVPSDNGWPFIYDKGTGEYVNLSDSSVLDLSGAKPTGWLASYLADIPFLTTPKENITDALQMFNDLSYQGLQVDYYCWYSTSFTPEGDSSDDGLTAYEFTIDDPQGDNLTAVRDAHVGDGLVTPYSGSFGKDASFEDAKGASQLSPSNVAIESFENIAHIDMVTDPQILKAIKANFPELNVTAAS